MTSIRLRGTGTKNRRKWRIVVCDSRVSRDGSLIEELGSYNPLVEPPALRINQEHYQAWVKKGARPSEAVRALMKKAEKSADAH